MEHKGTKTLETKHLLLSPFKMEDAKAMYHNGPMTLKLQNI